VIFTDHKPLTFAFSKHSDAWSARQQRHLSAISEFTTRVQHLSGKNNLVSDALSRTSVNALLPGINYLALAEAQCHDASNHLQLNNVKTKIHWLWCLTTRQQNHLPYVAENHKLPSGTVQDLGILINNDVTMRSRVLHCQDVLPCYDRHSVSDSCVPFAGHVAGYATSQLWQCNTRGGSCIPAPSTSVCAQSCC